MAEESKQCVYSVSCTTRPPREGEVDGQDYHFLSESDFEERVADGQLLEFARVHDRFYGTLKGPVLEQIRNGIDVLMDLDIQGAEQLRKCEDEEVQRALVDIFILPPSLEELKNRIAGRGAMAEEELALRMRNAEREIRDASKYRHRIVSGDREADFRAFGEILETERELRRAKEVEKPD